MSPTLSQLYSFDSSIAAFHKYSQKNMSASFCITGKRRISHERTLIMDERKKVRNRNYSRRESIRQRQTPPYAERFRGNFQPRRSLLPLIFIAIDACGDFAHQANRELPLVRDLLRRFQILDIASQYAVQHIVGRQAILIRLPWPKLRRRRLGQACLRDQFPLAVPKTSKLIDQCLGHIANYREPACHIAIQSAVSDR